MFLVFVDCAQTACYLFYGPWVAYMATETILLGLSSHAGLKNQPWMPLTGIQILRICILFMLVCSFSIYPTRKTRVHSDEENTPLLVTENANSNGVDSPQGCTSVNGYATINREEEDILSTLQDGKEKQKKPSILEDFLVSASEDRMRSDLVLDRQLTKSVSPSILLAQGAASPAVTLRRCRSLLTG